MLYRVLRLFPNQFRLKPGDVTDGRGLLNIPFLLNTRRIEEVAEDTVVALPEGFPGRRYLAAAGLRTFESLVGLDEAALVALKGIGVATAQQILQILAEDDAQVSDADNLPANAATSLKIIAT
jgi:hypothetical protein